MRTDDVADHVELIRQAFGYITRFKGRTFVLKIENPVIDDPAFRLMVRDITLLHQLGIRVVIVPGTKERIDEVLTRYGVRWDTEAGVRVSTPEMVPFIKMAASDVANRVMTLLAQNEAERGHRQLGEGAEHRGPGRRGLPVHRPRGEREGGHRPLGAGPGVDPHLPQYRMVRHGQTVQHLLQRARHGARHASGERRSCLLRHAPGRDRVSRLRAPRSSPPSPTGRSRA